ncbi:MAG: hypothetical protein ABR545_06185 [Cyclonatronaceae bacterium]
MHSNLHLFHIPVMGTGHSVDSPVRVAHLGINSVISIVDDLLLEQIREYYCRQTNREYTNIGRTADDGRARRITAYLDLVNDIVQDKFEAIRQMDLFSNSEKDRYFNLLPDSSPLRDAYEYIKSMAPGHERYSLIQNLNEQMKPGSIDVNIMAKVDRLTHDRDNVPLSKEFSDASAALRGYANSVVSSAVVLSAGFNPRLYGYLSEFRDFYRDKTGDIRKKIVLKVTDFRSAMIQSRFLAKSGIEISEFRIESGLNCGGHAFASDGHLMPVLLREFRDKREELVVSIRPMITRFYEKMGWEYPEAALQDLPSITVQGGIGNHGEVRRLLEEYGMDATGWGSPFLLVPEATCIDDPTVELLKNAGEEDLYLSNVSPLGIPFNNIRNSGSEVWTKIQSETDKPGSKCPKGFLVSNTEFTENPICTASTEYQILKISSLRSSGLADDELKRQIDRVTDKNCLCSHLGIGALMKLGIRKESYGRQAICPGPNIAWFNRTFTLDEMVDHIYGRRESLVPANRPHMFAKELEMYVDYLEERLRLMQPGDEADYKKLMVIRDNLETGMDECLLIADGKAYSDENLPSLKGTVTRQRKRMRSMFPEPVPVE